MRKIYLFTFMMLLLVHLKGQAQQITLHVERAGTLHGMINASRLPYITDLKLTGELNGTDISFIRTLVKKNLRFLDLSEARIVEGGAIYYSNYRTSNDIIGSYMFYNPDYSPISPCAISKINLPNSVTGIEEGAFKSCTRLTDINIPNSVTSIGPETFLLCDNLKSVYMNASTPPFIGSQAFHNISKDLTIYIPRGSYTAYWLSYWGNYNLVEYDPTDIQGVTTSAHNGVEKYFSIDGRPLPGPCKGVNIIQDTDGKTRKAWIP